MNYVNLELFEVSRRPDSYNVQPLCRLNGENWTLQHRAEDTKREERRSSCWQKVRGSAVKGAWARECVGPPPGTGTGPGSGSVTFSLLTLVLKGGFGLV